MRIVASFSLVPYFQMFFQTGVQFRCSVGTSVEDFLLRQLELETDLVNERISTIFLDGSCVDHIETAVLKNGSVLALSGALPGLAGASMRRDGYYASMRNSITLSPAKSGLQVHEGIITIKLFNLLIGELGPIFLRKGIVVHDPGIINFFRELKEDFWKGIDAAYLEDRPVSPRMLAEKLVLDGSESVMISVQERAGSGATL